MRKDGSRFWAHVIIDPIRDDDGELIGFAKITRDITERKQAQRGARRRRARRCSSRRRWKRIGQLTGGVAHDFNNLLMAVLGSLELLRKRLPDDPHYAAAGQRHAGRAARRDADPAHAGLRPAPGLKLEAVDVAGADARHVGLAASARSGPATGWNCAFRRHCRR